MACRRRGARKMALVGGACRFWRAPSRRSRTRLHDATERAATWTCAFIRIGELGPRRSMMLAAPRGPRSCRLLVVMERHRGEGRRAWRIEFDRAERSSSTCSRPSPRSRRRSRRHCQGARPTRRCRRSEDAVAPLARAPRGAARRDRGQRQRVRRQRFEAEKNDARSSTRGPACSLAQTRGRREDAPRRVAKRAGLAATRGEARRRRSIAGPTSRAGASRA